MTDLKQIKLALPLVLLALCACAPRVQADGQAGTPPYDDGSSTVVPVPAPFAPPDSQPVASTVTYACDGGQSVTVSYLGASVAQLSWQGDTYTLNQTESASGVRYTNGFYTWVTKGNQGFLDQPGLNQPSITVANNCVARAL